MNLRAILGKIGLAIGVFIIVSPAILFFLWMASLSVNIRSLQSRTRPLILPPQLSSRGCRCRTFSRTAFIG